MNRIPILYNRYNYVSEIKLQTDILSRNIENINNKHFQEIDALINELNPLKSYENLDDLQKSLFEICSSLQNLLILQRPKDKKFIGVENAAKLVEFSRIKPNLSKKSICLVLNAETISVQAQNKLLKVLEELPEFLEVYFFSKTLTNILPTIRSRIEIIEQKYDIISSAAEQVNEIENIFISILSNVVDSSDERIILEGLTQFRSRFEDHVKLKGGQANHELIELLKSGSNWIRLESIRNTNFASISAKINKRYQISLELDTSYRLLNGNVNYKLVLDRLLLIFLQML